MPKKVCVIGAGFAGLSAATHLAKKGFGVTLLEKNNQAGGRARTYRTDGFQYDMGPSWYWMPDVFERYFSMFEKTPSDYYQLIRLDPSYAVKFKDELLDIPAGILEFEQMCEKIEPGSSKNLRKFLNQAEYKYNVGINDLVYKPCRSLWEFSDIRLLKGLLKMDVLKSIRGHVHKYFKSPKLRTLLEFPVLFLGATPQETPALYSLMNYADIKLGTWYPLGGMGKIADGMLKLAINMGVDVKFNAEVQSFEYNKSSIVGLNTNDDIFKADIVVNGADYQHIDQKILSTGHRNYSPKYWDSRVMAPSSLLFYIGVNKRLPKMRHHTLFFDEDFDLHAKEIYQNPQWPTKPLLYTSATSITDPSVAPEGMENLVVLIPVAPDLEDTDDMRDRYYRMAIGRIEKLIGESISQNIVVRKSFAHREFKSDYNSFKGNAYGLANTLMQTAFLKPSLRSKKLKNLYHTGQLTVPGPGVPPSLISGEVVAKEIAKDFP